MRVAQKKPSDTNAHTQRESQHLGGGLGFRNGCIRSYVGHV